VGEVKERNEDLENKHRALKDKKKKTPLITNKVTIVYTSATLPWKRERTHWHIGSVSIPLKAGSKTRRHRAVQPALACCHLFLKNREKTVH
jgi:hypothetical protein